VLESVAIGARKKGGSLSEQPILAPPGIFKAYDIRGLYGEEMDETTAHAIGRAFARVLARLRGKSRRSCGSGSAATCASPRRRWRLSCATG